MFPFIPTIFLSRALSSSSTVGVPHAFSPAQRGLPGAASRLGSRLLPLFSRLFPPPPGTLLTTCICSASSELPLSAPPDFLTEGASAHLPSRPQQP